MNENPFETKMKDWMIGIDYHLKKKINFMSIILLGGGGGGFPKFVDFSDLN